MVKVYNLAGAPVGAWRCHAHGVFGGELVQEERVAHGRCCTVVWLASHVLAMSTHDVYLRKH